MPPGLKRYWQTHSRSGGKSRKRSSSKALVRYAAPQQIVRYKRSKPIVIRAKSRGGGKSIIRREHGAGDMIPGPFRLKSMGVSSMIGYSEAGKGFAGLQEFMTKLPTVGKLPKEAIAGAILNYFGDRNDWADAAAQAFLDIAAYKVGHAGYSISGDGDDD